MPEKKDWQFELDEYIKQGEPDQAEKSQAWKTAIGLQDVDGLETSRYLLDTAKDHIEGKIGIDDVQMRIRGYYEQRVSREEVEDNTREADIVAARITELLGRDAFQFSPAGLINIHRHLFQDVFAHAGQIRQYDIAKKEWVLKGATVTYAPHYGIRDMLGYDLATERQFSYEGLSMAESIRHLAELTANIWQIHPFCEGNTRTTAVFMIKYLRTLGFNATNDVFEAKSWYFRNALVRANYNDIRNGVHATTKFLEMFFSNLLLGTEYKLKNRCMHVDYVGEPQSITQSINSEVSKSHFDTLECTVDERTVLGIMLKNPSIKQSELTLKTGKSIATIKRLVASLQNKQYIRRINGKRFGRWEVLVQLPDDDSNGSQAM